MNQQTSIFGSKKAKYCIDTNVILNFWNLSADADEPYGKDIFKSQWAAVEEKIKSGEIVAVKAVGEELKRWDLNDLKRWLRANAAFLVDLDVDQLAAMRPIANKYGIYTQFKNFATDLQIMGLAKARELTVITSESKRATHFSSNPKIPNVCEEFDIKCVSLVGFFRNEDISF